MSTRQQIVDNLRTTWMALDAVASPLTAAQWAAPSLCPAWTVQGVLVHATTIEQALVGWRPGAENPFGAMGAIGAELSTLDAPALLDRFRTTVGRRLDELATMGDDEFDAPSITPVGPGTYARFMAIRVFDNWVHERDIRVPLGISGDDGGPAAEMALDEVQGSLGFIAGKKIGLPDGKGLAIEITGPVQRRMMVKVQGRAQVVQELPDPDVTVTSDLLTFMLLACGRIDPEQAIADGRITWSGDQELGARAARNLRFTM